MEAKQHSSSSDVKRRHTHEGPRNHIIAFIISIVLTLLAFMAIYYRDAVDGTFLLIFLLSLAVLQVIVQLAFWMHMKDRGHLYPTIFIAGGAVVAFTAIVMGVYWVWW